jgi:hypothetical protein
MHSLGEFRDWLEKGAPSDDAFAGLSASATATTAIVLAGGKNSRMGRPKALRRSAASHPDRSGGEYNCRNRGSFTHVHKSGHMSRMNSSKSSNEYRRAVHIVARQRKRVFILLVFKPAQKRQTI